MPAFKPTTAKLPALLSNKALQSSTLHNIRLGSPKNSPNATPEKISKSSKMISSPTTKLYRGTKIIKEKPVEIHEISNKPRVSNITTTFAIEAPYNIIKRQGKVLTSQNLKKKTPVGKLVEAVVTPTKKISNQALKKLSNIGLLGKNRKKIVQEFVKNGNNVLERVDEVDLKSNTSMSDKNSSKNEDDETTYDASIESFDSASEDEAEEAKKAYQIKKLELGLLVDGESNWYHQEGIMGDSVGPFSPKTARDRANFVQETKQSQKVVQEMANNTPRKIDKAALGSFFNQLGKVLSKKKESAALAPPSVSATPSKKLPAPLQDPFAEVSVADAIFSEYL